MMGETKGNTNEDFMNHVFEMVKENRCYEKAGAIMDYFLAEDYEVVELTNYDFKFAVDLDFGGSEGIYLDCYIKGNFSKNMSEGMEKVIPCGTFKTLEESLEAMQIMGELAGALIYFASHWRMITSRRYMPAAKSEKAEQ